jgi:hypothetical protein
MPKRSSKRSSSSSYEFAGSIVESAASESNTVSKKEKNPAAVALGHLGGLKGGPARAKKLNKKRRSEIATKAAQARWQSSRG